MAKDALAHDFLIGQTLGHYRLVERVGKGGMGIVYRAEDLHLNNRNVALKILPQGALADDASRHRFRKESLALAKLNHPNIAQVIDFDSCAGLDFLVEEFVPGLTLDEMINNGPLLEQEIVNLGTQLCNGLAAAHESGVIHRDVKPHNIKVTSDAHLKILDFGLAKMLPQPAKNTDDTMSASEDGVVGTRPYMSPEQLDNRQVDVRTDIWAAGCVLYEMATGRRPFLGRDVALDDEIRHQSPAIPSMLNQRVNPALESIIVKCLEKDPALRYQSAREIAVDLRRLQAPSSVIPVPVPPRPQPRWPKFALVLIAVVALCVAAYVAYRFIFKSPPSIAVLPFVDMSPEHDQAYLSDGLAEELTNDLAKLPGLRVTASASSRELGTRDRRIIKQKLNVSSYLDGTVRKYEDRVRITVQLIDVDNGFSLWSETYERKLGDIFSVQEEIARSVASALKVRLLEKKVSPSSSTTPEAYSAYLQGQYFQERATRLDVEKSITHYREALKFDSNYAPAWVGLGRAYLALANNYAAMPLEEGSSRAREAAQRAVTLDQNLADAHALLGYIQMIIDWDWPAADASFRRALDLEPGNVNAIASSSVISEIMGRCDEALDLARQAVLLNPVRATARHALATRALRCGRLAEAETVEKAALELSSDGPAFHYVMVQILLAESRPAEALAVAENENIPALQLAGLALTNYALGKRAESDAALAQLISQYPSQLAFQIASIYAYRGQSDEALLWLDRAYANRDSGLISLRSNALFSPLQHDPRFVEFKKKKMRFPL